MKPKVYTKLPKKFLNNTFNPVEFSMGLPYTDDVPDYHFICNAYSPVEYRKIKDLGPVYINAAICGYCFDFVRSKNRHDYRSCKCNKTVVDGGSWYCKRSGDNYINVVMNFELDK